NTALVAQNAQLLFGTDEFVRDIFSRLVYGSRITLYIVLLVSVTVGPLGLLLGVSAGYFAGKGHIVLIYRSSIFV
ncbi:D,D-dipeptide ABC transporter permease, partial [Klebsiella pneumoniae]